MSPRTGPNYQLIALKRAFSGASVSVTEKVEIKEPRDLRLDFFRGLAMFIILLAHTPGNTWTLWIPARFGFSDATEIFVFCSGMASSLAFGAVFVKKGWHLGAARIVFRVWQVYWAHIGVVLATAFLMLMLDKTGMGAEGKVYANWPSVVRLFTMTEEYIPALFTLNFVPGLLDILPMYLVILAMVPLVMGVFLVGGRYAVFAFVLAMWFAAQLAGWARSVGGGETHAFGMMLASIGAQLDFLNLPASPLSDNRWFFNPFGWQLVFFTGFAFGMRWLPAPPVNKTLVWTAVLYLLLTLPLAWFKIHGGQYLPAGTFAHDIVKEVRAFIEPLRWKPYVGGMRYLHFLAIGYLAWAAVGAGGVKLYEGWNAAKPAKAIVLWIAVALMIFTIPYAYVDEIKWLSPSLDQAIFELFEPMGLLLDENQIGIPQLVHLVSLMIVIWAMIGDGWRVWAARDAFLATVPIIRKVGTQSLAVFMVSIVLSRFNGWWLDVIGRDVWTRALVNLTGFAILIAVAYGVGWFKSQPWRHAPQRELNTKPPDQVANTRAAV